ncbi:MAG: hypothetical protein HZA35_03885 [Parcubacteria group bacterium]|nr:hypothetical protein [Parcubacteria group bacterium]
MEDAEHRKGRIRFLYKKQQEFEAERRRLIEKLRRNCLHGNFAQYNGFPVATAPCVRMCRDCGFEEEGMVEKRSSTFLGCASSVLYMYQVNRGRDEFLQYLPIFIE